MCCSVMDGAISSSFASFERWRLMALLGFFSGLLVLEDVIGYRVFLMKWLHICIELFLSLDY